MEKPALLLTRPRASAERFCAQLDASVMDGVQVVISPLLEIVPTGAVADLSAYAGVIFTSAHAPPCVDHGNDRVAYCVGKQTAQTAKARGWNVVIVAKNADDLVGQIRDVRGPLLHLAGQHRRGEIAERLAASGVATDVVAAYDQPQQQLNTKARTLLSGTELIIAPFFSPRSAGLFVGQVLEIENVHVLAMSEAVAAEFSTIMPKQLHITSAPTGEEMRRSVEKLLVGAT